MTCQLEISQSTLNVIQRARPNDTFGRNLPDTLINLYKKTALGIKSLTPINPMYRFFFSLNVVFVIAIITLSAVTARSWMHPKYPSKVDGENKKNSSRKVAHLGINRQVFSPQSVNQIVENNLFRKERAEYQPPASTHPISQVVKNISKPVLPPPKINLRGVMLMGDNKIAFLEGTYPESVNNKVENTPIKRKGYYLGSKVGNYKIAKINKREIVLNNYSGQIFTIKLKRNINRVNETLKHKKRKPKFTSTRQVAKKKPQPAPRISGTSLTPMPMHISGR